MAKTLTLRLNNDDSAVLNTLIHESADINTASKLFIACMKIYPLQRDKVDRLEREVEQLERENERLMQLIENARLAAHALWDKTAQKELLIS